MSGSDKTRVHDEQLALDIPFTADHQPPERSGSIRIHILLPHAGFLNAWDAHHHKWWIISDGARLTMLEKYIDAATNDGKLKHVVVLPAGFLQSDLREGQAAMAATLRKFSKRRLIVCGGTDDIDGSQYAWVLDLSEAKPEWPVVVSKFVGDHANPGKAADARTFSPWQGINTVSLCCMDALSLCGGGKPDALSGVDDAASLRLIVDSAHYHGGVENSCFGVRNAGPLTRGLGRAVRLPRFVDKELATMAVISFYGDDPRPNAACIYKNKYVKMSNKARDVVMNETDGLFVTARVVDLK